MNDSPRESVYKACGGVLVTHRRTEPTVLLWRSGMSAHVPTSFDAWRQPAAIQNRLLNKVGRTPNGCWEWTAYRNKTGYGKIGVNGKAETASRIAYQLFCGPIPDGLNVLHRCDNPACCKPTHLFLGTISDNNWDKVRKGRANGPRGERASFAKLTAPDVARIRERYAAGDLRAAIAADYKVDETTITCIALGRSWRHVPGAVASRTLPPKLKAAEILAAQQMRKQGDSNAVIAARFGVAAETIRRTLKRHGIEG